MLIKFKLYFILNSKYEIVVPPGQNLEGAEEIQIKSILRAGGSELRLFHMNKILPIVHSIVEWTILKYKRIFRKNSLGSECQLDRSKV